MSRYKGMSSKAALTAEDLAELIDIHCRLQKLHSGLNAVSSQRFPLMAGDVPLNFHPAATRVLGLVTPRSVG